MTNRHCVSVKVCNQFRAVEDFLAPIPKARIVTQTADFQIDRPGVTYMERGIKTADVTDSYSSLPNILAILDGQTLSKISCT